MEQTINFELTASEANLILAALSSFTAPLVSKIQQQATEFIAKQASEQVAAEQDAATAE